MRKEYMKSLLRQDAAWFDQQKTGTLTAQLSAQVSFPALYPLSELLSGK